MATNFLQPGDHLTIAAAPYALASGDGCQVGDGLFGVAQGDADSGAEVVLAVVGVHRILKVLSDDVSTGDLLYWDNTDKAATLSSATGANLFIGVAVADAGTTSTTVDIRLSP